jgi:hypothetical protein
LALFQYRSKVNIDTGFNNLPPWRGISELIAYSEYRNLDLTPFSFARIDDGRSFIGTAVIWALVYRGKENSNSQDR